jgi:hypothetical protein
MKAFLLVSAAALVAAGCSTTSAQSAWGKPGVSKTAYGTDVGECTGLAVQASSNDTNNTAGGVGGRNNSAAGGGSGAASPSAAVPAGGMYSGMASSDYAQRAATQQRTQEMAAQRARSDALKSCMTGRGYQEISLTPAQAAELAKFQKGTSPYYEYLYKLGSDAEVVSKQSRAPAK